MATPRLIPPVPNFRPIVGTKLFRSSNLYSVDEAGMKTLSFLNIRSIVDLRRCKSKSDQSSILDNFYVPMNLEDNTPFYVMDAATREGILKEYRQQNEENINVHGLHYHSDLLDASYVRGVFWRCPWYTKPLFGLLILLDRLLGTSFGYEYVIVWRTKQTGLGGFLRDLADLSGDRIYSVLRLLMVEANIPAVVMCSLGKDRTGLICTLIQLICEVEQDTIVQDYVQSQVDWRPHAQQMNKKLKSVGFNSSFGLAKAETIIQFINYINERYGSVAAYCEVIGFTAEMQIKLRRNIKVTS